LNAVFAHQSGYRIFANPLALIYELYVYPRRPIDASAQYVGLSDTGQQALMPLGSLAFRPAQPIIIAASGYL
jgi:hypothetical protein